MPNRKNHSGRFRSKCDKKDAGKKGVSVVKHFCECRCYCKDYLVLDNEYCKDCCYCEENRNDFEN